MSTANPHRRSLRWRLLSYLLPVLSLILVISAFADYRLAINPAHDAYDIGLADDALALSGRVSFTVDQGFSVDLPKAAEAILKNDRTDSQYWAIYGPHGELIGGDADLKPDAVEINAAPRHKSGTIRGLTIRKATYKKSTLAGDITIVVAETTRKRQRTVSRIFAAMMMPNVLLIAVSLLLVYFGVQHGLNPLNQLSHEISKRSPDDLTPLPKVDIPGEAAPLIDALNMLIDDLRQAIQAQQRFLAMAAHQLQTPITGLQTQLELAADELPDEYKRRMRQLAEASERVSRLTHQLLALARSGADANLVTQFRPVDLSQLIHQNASAWYDAALAKDIDLGFEAEPARTIGSEWLLNELITNLIDNAINYTPHGGIVTARCGCDASGTPFVEVEDSGHGIDDADHNRIFERFYRKSGERGPGSGLGLSIVKEVADRHQAHIDIGRSKQLGGAIIRVRFAAQPDTTTRH